MILFTILLLTLIAIIGFTILFVSAAGAAGIVLFSDVIVCAVLIALLIWFITKRKK